MAASLLLFVFIYVFLMRIVYKLSRVLADWLAGFLTAADRREMEIKDVIIVLKNDQSKIRPQDEFAKYMRLDRKINQLTEDLSRLAKQTSDKLAYTRRILALICFGILGICHLVFLMKYRMQPVAVLPVEWFYPINSILAFPAGVAGAIGLPCWIVASNSIISRMVQ
ncbi:guided entry of tail-anchored proteins factor 1-like [Montipora capricornis]|uniref:guided entry of tail-anchored proteins factor 1-like n=1 Tax=Montipora foliosa TaxID=591990 RepID=UPI0035F12511